MTGWAVRVLRRPAHDESLDWSGLFLRLAIPFLIRYNGDKR